MKSVFVFQIIFVIFQKSYFVKSFNLETLQAINDFNKILNISSDCECGIAKNSRIVGAAKGEFPFFAAITYCTFRKHQGPLFAVQVSLTGFGYYNPENSKTDFEVVLGEYNIQNSDQKDGSLRYKVDKVFIHELYTTTIHQKYDNDIAIIRLDGEIDFLNTKFKPVCFPTIDSHIDRFARFPAIVTGFGRLGEKTGKYYGVLQKVVVPVFYYHECYARTRHWTTRRLLCSGYLEGKKDSCQGDSGGPLFVVTAGRYVQIGVVSFGSGCARPGQLGFYSRVSEFMPWILEKTKTGQFCRGLFQ